MKIAIISDMHGNCLALDTVLADIQRDSIDQIVCLGDAIQGGPQPSQVVSRLRELAFPVVLGNADDWLLTGYDSGAEKMSEERRRKLDIVRDWQLTQLSEDDLAFIKTFKPTIELPAGSEYTLLCYHGSPHSFDDVILPTTTDEEIRTYLEPSDTTIYTGGHTHMQFVRHLGRTFHFNPGSVGFAYRHDQPDDVFHADSWAEYALLSITDGRFELTFRRAPYDVEALINIYRGSGRPFADEAIQQYSV